MLFADIFYWYMCMLCVSVCNVYIHFYVHAYLYAMFILISMLCVFICNIYTHFYVHAYLFCLYASVCMFICMCAWYVPYLPITHFKHPVWIKLEQIYNKCLAIKRCLNISVSIKLPFRVWTLMLSWSVRCFYNEHFLQQRLVSPYLI